MLPAGGRIIRIGAIERAAYAVGTLCLTVAIAATLQGRLLARASVDSFDASVRVDQAEWSPHRIQAYAAYRGEPTAPPVAVLRIPRLSLSVPVHEGVGSDVLDRGAGHLPESARPGESGNVAIAGHRDGFFRGLKDVRSGDRIHLQTRETDDLYVVEHTWVVEPEDLSVLDPTPSPALTLITCYPFYFVGSAPKRFIVRAVRAAHGRHSLTAGGVE